MTNSVAKRIVQIALICALLVIFGLFPGIPLGIIPVSIELQDLGVMLAGELLKPRDASLAVGAFLLLVLLGLPVLTGGRGGAAVFVGPTSGYLFGWLLTPSLNAWLLEKTGASHKSFWLELGIAVLVLVGLIDFMGTVGLVLQSGMAFGPALAANLAFIPGDTLKALLAVGLARRLRRVLH